MSSHLNLIGGEVRFPIAVMASSHLTNVGLEPAVPPVRRIANAEPVGACVPDELLDLDGLGHLVAPVRNDRERELQLPVVLLIHPREQASGYRHAKVSGVRNRDRALGKAAAEDPAGNHDGDSQIPLDLDEHRLDVVLSEPVELERGADDGSRIPGMRRGAQELQRRELLRLHSGSLLRLRTHS